MVARSYTARDQLGQIDYNSAMVATFAYDPASRPTSRVLGDTPGTQTAWVYGRQDNLPTAINSAIPGASFTYTYDANKNKLTEGISSPMANFGFNSTSYDPADRLTAWNRTDGNLDQAWNLSLVGDWATFTENQLQQTRSHTAVHEIAAIDANPIAHDPAGNLTRNAGDTLDRYTWDFDNRLLAADVDQDGTAECGYRYDALGRRVSKSVPDGEASVTTVFVGTIQALEYSPHAMQVVAEYPADAAPASPARKFVYAEYIDEPIMMLGTSGATTTPYYYHQNSLYSVSAITDASGAVVERYAYSAYGKPLFLDAAANLLDPQASTIDNPYLFTARRLDPETGLYYYRARMYDAELGRFVSRDPIGYEGSEWNLYQYVGAGPLVRLDAAGYQAGPTFPGDAMWPEDRCPPARCTQADVDDHNKKYDECVYIVYVAYKQLFDDWEAIRDEFLAGAGEQQAACLQGCKRKYPDEGGKRALCQLACRTLFKAVVANIWAGWAAQAGVLSAAEAAEYSACGRKYPCHNKKVGDRM